MAQKRMFSLSVVDTDDFLEMPISSRLLYYELGMRADDDGFISNWKKILTFTGLKTDDIKILISKKFIIPFESGVIVIRHWRLNNYLRNDRYKETNYLYEKSLICKDKNGVYELKDTIGIPNGIPSIDKNSIDKNSIEEKEVQEKEEEIGIPTIYDFIESEFGRPLSPTEYEYISKWEDNDLTRYAVKQAVLNNAPRLKYIQAILNNYRAKNIKTVQDAQNDEKNFKKTGVPEWFGKEFQKEEIDPVEEAKLKNELQKVINGGN